jgi:hypothetical protein
MPTPGDPCSNCAKTKAETVEKPAGATMMEATSSRVAIANTSSMATPSEGSSSGSRMRHSSVSTPAPDTRAASSRLRPICWNAAPA